MRFLDTTYWPSAMAVAATGDPSLAEAEGRVVAREARGSAINHILAPVADVNVDPDNPVINTRSFGEDPARCRPLRRGVHARRAVGARAGHREAFSRPRRHARRLASRAAGARRRSRERLDSVELVPFRAAIDAGVKSIMIGHLAVPALDDELVPVRRRSPARIRTERRRPRCRRTGRCRRRSRRRSSTACCATS